MKDLSYSLPEAITTHKYRPGVEWKTKKIDYLLHSSEFELKSASNIAEQVLEIEYGCPNEICPSDHIYIEATLLLK